MSPTSSRAIANIRFQVRRRNQSLQRQLHESSGGEHDQLPLLQREEWSRQRGELAVRLLLTFAHDRALEDERRATNLSGA